MAIVLYGYCFFFQAEDGIRDYKVTGVQTCALPICVPGLGAALAERAGAAARPCSSGSTGAFSQRSAEARYTFVSSTRTSASILSIVSSFVCHHHGKPALPTSRSIARDSSVSCFGSPESDMKAEGTPAPQNDWSPAREKRRARLRWPVTSPTTASANR